MFIRTQTAFFMFLWSFSHPERFFASLLPESASLHTACRKTESDGAPRCGIRVRSFLADQRGMNTVELVVIIAVVVGLALLFRARITTFVTTLLDGLFSDDTAKGLVEGIKLD